MKVVKLQYVAKTHQLLRFFKQIIISRGMMRLIWKGGAVKLMQHAAERLTTIDPILFQ